MPEKRELDGALRAKINGYLRGEIWGSNIRPPSNVSRRILMHFFCSTISPPNIGNICGY